jgi:hypothetical protein
MRQPTRAGYGGYSPSQLACPRSGLGANRASAGLIGWQQQVAGKVNGRISPLIDPFQSNDLSLDAIEACESVRWPEGKEPGGKG